MTSLWRHAVLKFDLCVDVTVALAGWIHCWDWHQSCCDGRCTGRLLLLLVWCNIADRRTMNHGWVVKLLFGVLESWSSRKGLLSTSAESCLIVIRLHLKYWQFMCLVPFCHCKFVPWFLLTVLFDVPLFIANPQLGTCLYVTFSDLIVSPSVIFRRMYIACCS